MVILGIDTSGKLGSIALLECGDDDCAPLGVAPLEGGTFSAQLIPQIASLLQKHGMSKHQIDAFAVVSGPGSFTGLRVGLAAIKGLAEILSKSIVPVSLLEAIAVSAGTDGRTVAALDAGRGEIYAGTYDIQSGRAVCVSEQVLSSADLVSEFAGARLVTPDQRLADLFRQKGMPIHEITAPRADTIARIGYGKLQRGETATPEALDATYIRRSEAEIKLVDRNR